MILRRSCNWGLGPLQMVQCQSGVPVDQIPVPSSVLSARHTGPEPKPDCSFRIASRPLLSARHTGPKPKTRLLISHSQPASGSDMEPLEVVLDGNSTRQPSSRVQTDDKAEQKRGLRSPGRKSSVRLEEVMEAIEKSKWCENPYAVTAEFFGTFIFLFGTTLGVTYSQGETISIATNYGITLAVAIFIMAPVSGGHLNPAVSLAMALYGAMTWHLFAYYVGAQVLGGICGVAVAYGVADELIGSIFVNDRVSFASAFFGEAIGTWFLILTVFITAVQTATGKPSKAKASVATMAPMIIGWSVWAIHFALIGVTGCGVNPARFLATAIVMNKWRLNQVWIYLLGPILGAIVAIPTFKMMYPKEKYSSPNVN